MKIDWFTAPICESASDMPPEKLRDLSKRAEAWLRTGAATISWAEWQQLDPMSMAALEDAGNRLWIERAGLIGLAAAAPEAAVDILSGVDGGKLRLQIAMATVMGAAAKRLEETVKS